MNIGLVNIFDILATRIIELCPNPGDVMNNDEAYEDFKRYRKAWFSVLNFYGVSGDEFRTYLKSLEDKEV
jgi:hypothetical protein